MSQPRRSLVADVSGSISARRRARRRQRALRVLIAVLAVGIVAIVIWVVGFSSALSLRHVDVRGTVVVATDDVLGAAEAPEGRPLARVDTSAIAARVEALRPVAAATVSREWPHTLRITVSERVAVYVWNSPVGYQLVDRTGTNYLLVDSPPAGLLPVTIENASERLLADAATVVAALPDEVRERATKLTVASADSFVITLSSGATIAWGSAEDSAQKAEVIVALLTIKAGHYDVSSPSHPATRP